MAKTIARMTRDELKEIIEATVEVAVEQKLLEILGDPDDDLEVRKSLRARLRRQKQAVAAGERGRSFEDVAQELGLE